MSVIRFKSDETVKLARYEDGEKRDNPEKATVIGHTNLLKAIILFTDESIQEISESCLEHCE